MTGLLLTNLGTPDTPEPQAVKRYLTEFLMDPEVVTLPTPLRFLLVRGLIIPLRYRRSAQNYQKIWTDRGSPLRFHLQDLVEKIQTLLEPTYQVQGAMRYGQPSLYTALKQFESKGIQKIVVLPLYPQYASATTQSTLKACLALQKKHFLHCHFSFIPPFFEEPEFIQPLAQQMRQTLQSHPIDHWLFSFHGLPESQIRKTDRSGKHCLQTAGCCDIVTPKNYLCYRAQCFGTARALAQALPLSSQQYSVGFQSRLGPTRWISPHTEALYQSLPSQGVRHLGVVCPSFVADCVETLEEVLLRGQELFLKAGGTQFTYVPCLNSHSEWAHGLCQLIQRFFKGHPSLQPKSK